MKSPLSVPISRGAIPLVTSLRKRFATVLMVAAATALGTGIGLSQGVPPGNYYQANPPGSGITGATYNELSYVNSFLPANVSLYNPVPPGDTAATASQLASAVTAATNNFLSASPSTPIPAGVTLASIATQIAANNYSAATGSTGTMAALANSIISNQSTANAQTSLTSVVSALAAANPTTIATLGSAIFTSAAANASLATYVPQLALAATTAPAVSSNDQTVGAVVAQALNAVASSTNSQQSTLQSIVASQFSSATITNSQASIGAIAKSMVNGTVMAVVSAPNLPAYVQSAVNSLPAGAQTNVNVGAIFLGMVASGSLTETAVVTDLSGAGSATAGEKAYLSALNTGYNSTSGNLQSNISGNPTYVDGIVAGAISSGTVANATAGYSTLLTDAFSVSGTTVQSIVAAAINADLVKNTSDNSPTIAGSAIAATSAGNFAAVAQGAVGGGRAAEAGTITSAMLIASPGYSATYSSLNQSTFTTTNVQNLVAGALTGAYGGAYGTADINSKPGAVGQIIYQSEVTASNFSGATAANYTTLLPLAEAVATQAITTMKALDTVDSELPTYIAAAAAFAGYGGPATNLPTIQSQLTSGTVGSYSSANAIAAINAVEPVVQNYKTATTTGYTQTIAAYASNSSASDSVMAILYGASLSNPVDDSALLAAAVAKVPNALVSNATDSDANLLALAIAANPANQTNLTIANTVALHIATNLAAHNASDISNFVGYQVAQNPTYVNDIAAAAVAVDPNQANYVARAISYNDPQTAYTAIPSIFAYSQLTSMQNDRGGVHTGEPANTSLSIDMASAAAAISAGYATGLVEAAQSPALTPSAANTTIQQAFMNGVSQAVASAIQQNGIRLTGQNLTNAPTSLGLGSSITINGTTGVPTYSGSGQVSSAAVGAAGVVTGIISQVVTPGDSSFGGSVANSGAPGTSLASTLFNTSSTTAAQIVNAILKSTVYAVQNGAFTGSLNTTSNVFVTQIAQAAGQAFGFVSGINPSNDTTFVGGNLTTAQEVAIAQQMAYDLTGLSSTSTANNYKLAFYAAYYGLTQGQSGVQGAGASGVSQTGAYNQNGGNLLNATGQPVTDIFNL